jgi:hypothetical protein
MRYRNVLNGNEDRLNRQQTRSGGKCTAEDDSMGIVWIVDERDANDGGRNMLQYLKRLAESPTRRKFSESLGDGRPVRISCIAFQLATRNDSPLNHR